MNATSPILAIVYSDGLAADRLISELGYRLRDAGVKVAGIVQHNEFNPSREKCDMDVEELASGELLRVSEDRGKDARGCRLNHSALTQAAALLSQALQNDPEIIVVNKFGKLEAEGKGVRGALAEAVELGIPVLVGVPYRNIEQWRLFAGGLAEECELGSPRLQEWLSIRGFAIKDSAPCGSEPRVRAVSDC
jgi:nucleoside-triphosphatase THEP1